jgi:site-specific DNA-methyltransferase (adenine-specific)
MLELYNSDCMEILKNMEKGSVDCVITDPPYGMGFQSNRAKDGPRYEKIVNDEKLFVDWIPLVYDLLKTGGGLISFCNWQTSCEWKKEFENVGFEIKSQVIWDRKWWGTGDLAGSFAPQHDVIWYATKGRRTFVNGRPKSVLTHQRPAPNQDFGHPTCKPVSLMEDLILGIDDGSDGIILDPFLGSGSTGVAAVKNNRKFIGIELEKNYFDIAKNRIDQIDKINNIFEME